MTLHESLEAMKLDALLYYATGKQSPEPLSTYRDLRNVATQILVTGGEISEDGKALLKRTEQ